MLMHHSHARFQCSAGLTCGQGLAEHLDQSFICDVMAKQDVHQRGLTSAIFTQKRHDLAPAQCQADGIICRQLAEALGNAVKAQDNILRLIGHCHHDALGSASSMTTVNEPSLIALMRSSTSFCVSAGILSAKVP